MMITLKCKKELHPPTFFLRMFFKKLSLNSIQLKSSCLFCMNFEIEHAKKGRGYIYYVIEREQSHWISQKSFTSTHCYRYILTLVYHF